MDGSDISRRSFLSRSTAAGAGAAAFTIVKPEMVRAVGPAKLKAGLVGCGGRGTEAAQQLLHGNPNVELVAMGDIFEDRLESSLKRIKGSTQYPNIADRVKVDPDRHFVGFDAYKKVIASDMDIVMLATPPGYRPEHFVAAVEAKKHLFSEKPFGTDPVGVRKIMAASEKARELKLTIMSGAQRRNQKPYMETWEKVRGGAIGDITACYAYWVGTPVIQQKNGRDPKWGDMAWQHRNWYSFVWICGDQVVEQHLHNIDVCNWFMGTHPVKMRSLGRRHLAAPHRDLRQHLRSRLGGFHLPQRRAHVELLPAVPAGPANRPQHFRTDRRQQGPHEVQRSGLGRQGRKPLCAGAHRHGRRAYSAPVRM